MDSSEIIDHHNEILERLSSTEDFWREHSHMTYQKYLEKIHAGVEFRGWIDGLPSARLYRITNERRWLMTRIKYGIHL